MSLGKPLVVVLNKIDLVKPELATAWKDYLQVSSATPYSHVYKSHPRFTWKLSLVDKKLALIMKRESNEIKLKAAFSKGLFAGQVPKDKGVILHAISSHQPSEPKSEQKILKNK